MRFHSYFAVFLFSFALIFNFPSLVSSTCFSSTGSPFEIWRTFPEGEQNRCAPGFYCPNLDPSNNSTWAVICPPSLECSAARLASNYCPPQGIYEPRLCTAGYYCPTSTQQIICPSGSYCSVGSVEPTKCSLLSDCSEGSEYEKYYGSILFILLFDLGLIFLISSHRRYEVKKSNEAIEKNAAENFSGQGNLSQSASNLEFSDSAKSLQVESSNLALAQSFAAAQSPDLKQIEVNFDKLTLKVPLDKARLKKQKKKIQEENDEKSKNSSPLEDRPILNSISGKLAPGRIYAVMGASGAGNILFD